MEVMETYKIQESIRDVILILDSAPRHHDLVYETNAVYLTNRVPIAHLAIERGLKSLLYRAGNTPEQVRTLGHSLNKLYRSLKECDTTSADILETAFQDTVNFFGYNVKVKGFGHFRTLYDYLSKVGTDKHFEAMRYWVIEDSGDAENPIHFVCPRTHRELLCALSGLLGPNQETVTERVDNEMWRALAHRAELVFASEDTEKERSVEGYYAWLKTRPSPRIALAEAVAQNFEIVTGNEVANKVIHTAYEKLQLSKDPAVVYYIHTLSYLSKGSQRSDVKPEVKWLDKGKRRGEVVTPASTCLGFIDWYPNGAWGIHPLESGLAGTKAIAWSHIDAAHFLVNRLTRGVVVTVNGPPESTRLVTWGSSFFSPMTWGADSEEDQIYDLEFWDSRHGLQVGDKCNVELPLDDNPHAAHIFDGVVTAVTKQKVGVRGSTILDFRKRTD